MTKRSGLFAKQSKMTKNCLSALDKTFSEICQELFHLKEIKKKCFSFILSAFESALKKLHSYNQKKQK